MIKYNGQNGLSAEEIQELNNLQIEILAISEEIDCKAKAGANDKVLFGLAEKNRGLKERREALHTTAYINFLRELATNEELYFENIEGILHEVTKENYSRLSHTLARLREEKADFVPDSWKEALFLGDNYEGAYYYLCRLIRSEYTIAIEEGLNAKIILKMLRNHASQLYEPPEEPIELRAPNDPSLFTKTLNKTEIYGLDQEYLMMYHNKPTDVLAGLGSGRNCEINKITGALTTSKDNVKLTIENFNKLAGTLGINTHKLLSIGMAQFTANNCKNGINRNYEVVIPLKEYGKMCGYDVEEHQKDTAEAQAKEKNRTREAVKSLRKKVKKDLDILANSSLDWSDTGKSGDWAKIGIIGSRGVIKGNIHFVFDPIFANKMPSFPLTQYPTALLGISATNRNPYAIGLKLSEHYFNDNNREKGTNGILKVSTVLSYAPELPTIQRVRENGNKWEDRIQDKLERALETLYRIGVLENWYYCKSKHGRLTYKEATSFPDYETWSELFIGFKLKNEPDQSERLKAKAERKEAYIKNNGRKKKRTSAQN